MPRPIAVQRHRDIMSLIEGTRAVSVEALAQRFDVSHETIRRDLKVLAGQGRVEIVHGGALIPDAVEPPYSERQRANAAGKARIATLGAGLIADGMVVLLDSGTTTHALAGAIAASGRKGLTICTTSLANAQVLVRAGHRVTLFGGTVDRDDEATTGIDVIEALARYSVDCAFVGVGGIGLDGVITDFTRVAALQRGAMLAAARQGYVVADHGKLGRVCPAIIPPPARFGWITDAAVEQPVVDSLAAAGVNAIHAR
ncbi:DeoR/GlpR family DNA-binding transcription regulator [Bosea lathyri]|uniref:Transcriptional regulator, DeoR family n=1 Tax=Bosea lathyri TaxID=1036778 RepID=A0A1H6CQB0_9HYPH|nr:DeoR/GlpR family DNA-binding transcription regulator [Bosea lathyri]SEG74795.1 transcriptional regulator, DeoR family [Bosea lathyri]